MLLRFPLDKVKITQYFGQRPEVYKPFKGHMGIDLRTMYPDSSTGERSVFAAAAGVVKLGNETPKGYGRFVVIDHDDGSRTIYGHLSAWCVQNGQRVFSGQRIAISGNTGFSDASHLHFGYKPPQADMNNGFGGYVDPLPFMTSIPTIPYFEQKKGQSVIAFLDPSVMQLRPISSGALFKMLFGDYKNINVIEKEEWSYPLSQEELIIG